MTKKDYLIAGLLTLIAGLFIFLNLGSTAVPESFWEARQGDNIIVELKTEIEISDIVVYYGIPASIPETGCVLGFEIYKDSNIGTWDLSYKHYPQIDEREIYVWRSTFGDSARTFTAKRIVIIADWGNIRINEIVFLDADGVVVDLSDAEITTAGGNPTDFLKAFDEQDKFSPGSREYEMYLDEIYYARAAYEQINGWENVDSAHPSFGKAVMGIGIRIFGMNPFGWRFMSALFGLLTIPLLYLFGKKLFGSSWFAGIISGLLVFDNMHLALSRLAALDTIAVFMLLLAYYCMLRFFKTNIKKGKEAYNKSLLWLGLSALTYIFAAGVTPVAAIGGVGLPVVFVLAFLRDKKTLKQNFLVPSSAIAGSLFAVLGAAACIFWYSPLTGGTVFYRPRVALGFTVNYWAGLFSLFFAVLFLVFSFVSKKVSGAEIDSDIRKKMRIPAFLLAAVAGLFLSFLLPWVSFAYQYYYAVVFMTGLIAFALREIFLISGGKIAVGRFAIPKGAIFCGVLLLLFLANFILTLPAVSGLPWIM